MIFRNFYFPCHKKSEIIGSIYYFKNLINDKVYIGKTLSLYSERYSEHKYNAFTKQRSNYIYRALRKYGIENFEFGVIFQTEILEKNKENKIIIDNILCEKEKYYILFYNTCDSKVGYNLTKGGDGIVGYTHTEETKLQMSIDRTGKKHPNFGNRGKDAFNSVQILQFDLDFNLIKEWDSIVDAATYYNINSSNISMCCSNTIDTYKNYIWVKKNDYFEGYLQKYKSRCKCKSNDITILQYDFLGNFIQEWISASEAARFYKVDPSLISGAANGKFNQGKEFMWIYKHQFTEELFQTKMENLKKCRFYDKIIKKLNNKEFKN